MQVSTQFGRPLPKRDAVSLGTSSPFRLLVLGDFGRDTSWGKPVSVDRDNIDDVLQRFNVRVEISGGANVPDVEIPVREMEDFHPDRLFQQLDLFAALRDRRQRLEDDQTFTAEAEAILAAQGRTDDSKPTLQSEPAPPATHASPSELLSEALEQTEAIQKPIAQQIAEGSLNIDDFVRRLVAPYVIDKADPRQAEFIDGVDDAIAETMRQLLHHPAFQYTEAAWLGIKMLVRRLETDATLQIGLVNISKQQLAEDLCGNDDLTKSELYKLLVDDTDVAGAEPWTVVVGNYTFGASLNDTNLLGRVAQVHAAAGSVFVAGASPSIVGCEDLPALPDPDDWTPLTGEAARTWQALRTLSATAHVALAMPRVLARRPYGADTDPIDSFRFEEIADGRVHHDYLWINAAFVVATLLGRSFSHAGWSLSAAWSPELDGLPIHVYSDDDESVLKPCGEVELILRAGSVLSDSGLTAVHSVRGQGSVRIPSLRSLSLTEESVAGPWQ